MITYPCGCVNERHEPTGALRSVSKCRRHTQASKKPETLGEAYYAEFGLLKNGVLQPTNHVAELTEALGPLPRSTYSEHAALEIGCGVSPYVGAIQDAYWAYTGLDASPWAAAWTADYWNTVAIACTWEAWQPVWDYGFILSAHALEHMADAPAALQKMSDSLESGGQLWLVVPNDDDPVNADHLWFFDEGSLRRAVESAGLTVEVIAKRKYVKHEHFLYCRASKP